MPDEIDLNELANEALATPPEVPGAGDGEPRRTRRTRADKGQPRGPRTGSAAGKKLADELMSPLAKLAKGLALTSPTAAAVLIEDGERTTQALVRIAERHPKMLAALRSASQVGPATDLLETTFRVAIAFQLDIGRIPPTHPLAVITGVSKLYHEVHLPAEGNGHSVPPPPVMPNDPRHPMYSFRAGPG